MKRILLLLFFFQSLSLLAKEVYWEQLHTPDDTSKIGSIVTDKKGNLYLSLCLTWSSGVYRKKVDSEKWECILPKTPVNQIFIAKDGTIYLSSEFFRGIYRSTDEGKTWTYTDKAMGINVHASFTFVPTNFIELDDGTILAGNLSFAAYFITTDKGESWHAWDLGDLKSAVNGLALNRFGELFAMSNLDYCIQRSRDTGKTWEVVSPPEICTTCGSGYAPIIFNPKTPYGIAMTCRSTTDDGVSWKYNKSYDDWISIAFTIDSTYHFIGYGSKHYMKQDIRRIQPDFKSYEIITEGFDFKLDPITYDSDYPIFFITSPDGIVYFATEHGRLFRSTKKYVSVGEKTTQVTGLLKILNNYNNELQIEYYTENLTEKLEIFDIYGNKCYETEIVNKQCGSNSAEIELSNLCSGLYFCRLGSVYSKFIIPF